MSTNEDYPKWKWEDTSLIYAGEIDFQFKDLKQLGLTRGATKKDLNLDKLDLAAYLFNSHDINLSRPLQTYTVKQLKLELKLRGLDHSYAKKNILISRFNQKPKTIHIDKSRWILQKSSPRIVKNRTVILLNDGEICVDDGNEFHKYNTISKKWTLWFSYGKHSDKRYQHHHSICDGKNIYTIFVRSIFRNNGYQILKTDIKTENCSEIIHFNSAESDFKISSAKLAVLHSQFHVIQLDNGIIKHFVLDENTQTYNKLHTFNDIQIQQQNITRWNWKFGKSELITVSIKNMMLFVIDGNTYVYSGQNYTWSKATLTISNNLNLSNNAVTTDGRYILIFDRCTYIIDLNTMKLMQNKAIKPLGKAVIANSSLQKEMVVFGYVRQCWENKKCQLTMPPDYIIKLISSWCCMENVHSFTWPNIHRMISVDQILKDMDEVRTAEVNE